MLAQTGLLAVVLICFGALTGTVSEPSRHREGFPFAYTIWHGLVGANACLVAVNMLPLPWFDGWRAWPVLLRSLFARMGVRFAPAPAEHPAPPLASEALETKLTSTCDEGDERSRKVVDDLLDRMREPNRRR